MKTRRAKANRKKKIPIPTNLRPLTAQERKLIEAEIADLKTYLSHALAIRENSKGKALLIALKEGFKMAKSFGGAEKAVVFTESRRTQKYLCELLSANGYKDKIMLLTAQIPTRKQAHIR
ncbi:MAG: hypothetical protein ACLUKN_11090 [Bacilli bacterium]